MKKQIKVWDLLIRTFHWSLVLTFTVAYFTGDEENMIHIYAGYIILGLISVRVIWGFIGSQHARFSDFTFSPKTIINYLKSMASGQTKHYVGHNPAGAAMILALLLGLAVTTYSGLEVYAIEEGAGPLAQQSTDIGFIKSAYDDEGEYNEDEEDEDFWEDIHETSADFVVFLVILHIAGVFIAGRLHNEKLVKAMITGNKEIDS